MLFDPNHVLDHVGCDKLNRMSTTTRSVANELGQVLGYNKGLPCRSHNPLNKWSQEIMQQIKYVISLLPQSLWLLNVVRW